MNSSMTRLLKSLEVVNVLRCLSMHSHAFRRTTASWKPANKLAWRVGFEFISAEISIDKTRVIVLHFMRINGRR